MEINNIFGNGGFGREEKVITIRLYQNESTTTVAEGNIHVVSSESAFYGVGRKVIR